jgi:hypothetical protein
LATRGRELTFAEKALHGAALYGKVKEMANSCLANFRFHLLCNAKLAKQSIVPPQPSPQL